MTTPHKHCEVIKAWADGKQIQYRIHSSAGWEDVKVPNWHKHMEYRVKPEKKKGWVFIPLNGQLGCGSQMCSNIYPTKTLALETRWPGVAGAVIEIEWEEGQGL